MKCADIERLTQLGLGALPQLEDFHAPQLVGQCRNSFPESTKIFIEAPFPVLPVLPNGQAYRSGTRDIGKFPKFGGFSIK